MIYAIAKLNKSSRARLSWIQSFAASFGIVPKPIYGHITLCPVEESQIDTHKATLTDTTAFPVNVTSIAVLEKAPAVAALVAEGSGLDDIRRKLGAEGPWKPHIELLRDTMINPSWVCTAMSEMFEPFSATIERIEFVRDTGRGFEVLDAVDLN